MANIMTCLDENKCKSIYEKRNGNQEYYCKIWQRKYEKFIENVKNNKAKILLHKHFVNNRSFERCISENNIRTILENGWIIEQTKNGGGVVRVLVLAYTKSSSRIYRPLHLVLEVIGKNEWIVITSYNPESHAWKWSNNLDERICFCNVEKGGF